MGFNFGAFAAGAVSGAGEIMEKQHKETKDSIDANMKFAYEQGLPFHRQRKKDLRRLEGYASDLRNFQLSPDQVSAVMGNSEDFIKDFITRSTAETQATGGKFDVASQITMPDNAQIRDWRGVHLGTVNLPEINQPTKPVNTSLLGKIMGTNNTGSSKGFNALVDRTKQEMSSITGTPYNAVAAAGQGAYNYTEGTESTISIVNTSAERAAEYAALQLKNLQDTSPITLANLQFQSQRAKTLQERQDATYKLTKIREEYEAGLLGKRIDSDIDAKLLDQELKDLVYKQMIQDSGESASQGLYLNTLGLMDEQAKANPDPEKIKLFTDNQHTMRLLIAEQYNTEAEGKLLNISYSTYESTFLAKVESRLVDVVSDDGLWIKNDRDGTRTFDYSSTKGGIEAEKIRKIVAGEMIEDFRTLAASGQPTSPALKMWLTMNRYFDPRLVTLPSANPNTPNDEIDPAQSYSYSQLAVPPANAEPVEDTAGKVIGYKVPTGKVIENVPVMSGTIAIPTHREYKVYTGKQLLKGRGVGTDGEQSTAEETTSLSVNTSANSSVDASDAEFNYSGGSGGSEGLNFGASTTQVKPIGTNVPQYDPEKDLNSELIQNQGIYGTPAGGQAMPVVESVIAWLKSNGQNVNNIKELREKVKNIRKNNVAKNPTTQGQQSLVEKYDKLKSQENNPTMSSDMYIKTLNLLLMQSVNSVHIEFAMAEIARLKEEG